MASPATNITTQFEQQLVKSTTLVFHVNLFIYAAIALVALFRIPHLVALFGTPSEWYNGHFLRYSPVKQPKVSRSNTSNSARTLVGEDTHHDRKRRGGEKDVSEVEVKYPPHTAVVPRQLRTMLSLSRVRILDGYSIGQISILAMYFYALVYATFFKSNPFTDATRPGWVAISQFPLIFALAQKNNILGSLLGYGYERLNYVHRFAAKLVILAANLHAVYYLYRWTAAGTFTELVVRPKNAWGMVALIFMNIMYFFSTSFWRNKAYNVFLWTHSISMIVILPTTYLHQPSLLPYVLACVFLYGADRVMRLFKTRIATAIVIPLPGTDITHIEVPSLNAGWRPGQHVRLRILSRRMGWLGWTEVHPFTIASAPDSHDCLIVMCKQSGDWTKRLGLMSKERGYVDSESKVKVWVEGPYGGPGRMMFASFSAAVLICGGSGITFGLTMMQDLLAKDLKGESRVKYVELVWVTQDANSITPLIQLFTTLIQQSVYCPLRISVYYTKPLTSKLTFLPDPDAAAHLPITLHHNFTLTPGRPRIGRALDAAIMRAVSLGAGHKDSQGITGLAVGVCGPTGLADDVVRAVSAVDSARKDQVGGIEIHEETFGW
ncbi:ferric reductase transmembrane component [Coprinopsis marcescibilis]|uniref:ferric-chelate reductase (NADPH) n=1 Tax=Coprinopsis marcescibilis TaxID=230819 RepID=A0A5C3KV90_COPMA|nr:ferric reductase transmembrane component [Coprinopsis marcescibilis]